MFTDGSLLYVVAKQKQVGRSSSVPQLVVETFDPKNNFKFVKAVTLIKDSDEAEPFEYDGNSDSVLASMQFCTNGEVLLVNLPIWNQFSFDLTSGKVLATENSANHLLAYNNASNYFFAVRDGTKLDRSFQRLF